MCHQTEMQTDYRGGEHIINFLSREWDFLKQPKIHLQNFFYFLIEILDG